MTDDNHFDEYMELLDMKQKINDDIKNSSGIKKGFEEYGLLDANWFKKYESFLEYYYKNLNNNVYIFDIDKILPKNEDKDYSYLGKNNTFGFPSNFVIVSKKLMDLLSNNFTHYEERKQIKNNLYQISFGGECIIMKDKVKIEIIVI